MMTPEEITAIRAKWADDVKPDDMRPKLAMWEHENTLRATIRMLCDELAEYHQVQLEMLEGDVKLLNMLAEEAELTDKLSQQINQ